VIIADDGSANVEELREICAKANLPEILFLALPHRGPAAARNAGAAAATSEYLAFTDADCLPEANWLEAFAPLARNADIIYGPITTEPGYLPPRWVAPAGEPYASANVMCRRETFLAIGGFDTRFQVPFREDTDFGYRALNAKIDILCAINAQVLHPLRKQSWNKLWISGLWHKNDAMLLKNFGYQVASDLGQPYMRPIRSLAGFSVAGLILTITIVCVVLASFSHLFAVALGIIGLLCLAIMGGTLMVNIKRRDSVSPQRLASNALASLPLMLGWYIGRLLGSMESRIVCL
jgi:hypothetical protein